MSIDHKELIAFLEEKVSTYNTPNFIESDPIRVPHQFSIKEDIEISGYLAATIAWGNRKIIIKNADWMMNLMGNAPFDFVMSHTDYQLDRLDKFVHRTFNGEDLRCFIRSLKNIYTNHGGLESIFQKNQTNDSMLPAISRFKELFFEIDHFFRTQKHVADPNNGSTAKRINMFLRWMCRKDNQGVDLGIWNINPSKLSCPLDVHSGNVARKLGLINRKQNDIRALSELDNSLRKLDPSDPVKYDFALFGLGIFEGF